MKINLTKYKCEIIEHDLDSGFDGKRFDYKYIEKLPIYK